jgi:adenine-specific DNA-methyltransferase
MNTENIKEKLKNKLKEIFQIEDLDLDFGIYKIMRYKKEEIEKFIEKDLIEETKIQFNLLSEEERKNKENELEELEIKLIDLGVRDYQNNEKYQQKLKEIEQIKVSEDLERDIYNHIINFFSRYYDNGDFISQRRYGKDDKYLIPYNGEEVKLYWANYDQYYIKTTEFFKRYSFEVGNLEVNFRVVEAEEEKSNIKSQGEKFFLLNEKRFELDNNVLNIYFDYRGLTEKEEIKYGKRNVQKNINEEICNEITNFVEKEYKKNQNLLLLFQKQSENEKSIIEKKLYHYTRRNTSDYFIHKDLKSFLERELDFYIKTEVVNIEDVSKLDVGELQKYSLKIKVIKNIADKIIEFVSQIENFQKKLWEKKKFILKTEYIITLDRIPEEFYEEILKNKAQLKEWENFSFEFLSSSLRNTMTLSSTF